MSDIPIPMRWDGEAMSPINQRWAKEADKQVAQSPDLFRCRPNDHATTNGRPICRAHMG